MLLGLKKKIIELLFGIEIYMPKSDGIKEEIFDEIRILMENEGNLLIYNYMNDYSILPELNSMFCILRNNHKIVGFTHGLYQKGLLVGDSIIISKDFRHKKDSKRLLTAGIFFSLLYYNFGSFYTGFSVTNPVSFRLACHVYPYIYPRPDHLNYPNEEYKEVAKRFYQFHTILKNNTSGFNIEKCAIELKYWKSSVVVDDPNHRYNLIPKDCSLLLVGRSGFVNLFKKYTFWSKM